MTKVLVVGVGSFGVGMEALKKAVDQASLTYVDAVNYALAGVKDRKSNIEHLVRQEAIRIEAIMQDIDYLPVELPEPVNNFKSIKNYKPTKSKGGVNFKRGTKNFRR